MTKQLLKSGDVIELAELYLPGSIRIPAETPFDVIQTRELAHSLEHKVVVLEFAHFVDGRGFSLGKMLKRLLPGTSELAAAGEIIPDQVPLVWQCGFDSIIISDELWQRCGPDNWLAA